MRLILYAILGFIIYYLLRGFSKGVSKRPMDAPHHPSEQGKELKMDPICGTYIPEDTPYRITYQGKLHYFCSEECMKTFQKKIAEKESK